MATVDVLGEEIRSAEESREIARSYHRLLARIESERLDANISVKLTALGLEHDDRLCHANLEAVVEDASVRGNFVRIDMENSPFTDVTLEVLETLWNLNYRNVGIVLQSDLYRTDEDVKRVNALGARVRLVKGAYKEPKTVAYQRKADVDAAYVRQMQVLLVEGNYPAIATHDPNMLEATKRFARERGISPDRFEFQMLYGIRRDLQSGLVRDGYRMRIYVPFGREWFPYFMRRLGERPANVSFVLRGLISDI